MTAISQAETPTSTRKAPLDLAVLILTFNEAAHIERAIASIKDIAKDIVVVDSFSTDDTVVRASHAGVRVLQNRFINYSRQFQWGLDHGEITASWIMRLDADEIIEPDLAANLRRTIPSLGTDVVGINLDRKHIFMGRWIKHGGRYPLRLLRVWRRGYGRIEQRWMDEHIVVSGGRTIAVKGGFADVNINSLGFFTDKHNNYATREAIDKLNQRYSLFERDDGFSSAAVSRQAAIKRWLKESFYNRLPVGVGPTGYFLYRYFVQLGLLDGRAGFIYHFLQGYWYRVLVDAKTVALVDAIADCSTNAERIARLKEITGLKLDMRS